MEITEYKVRLWDDQRLRALVTVVFDNCFVVRNIKVIGGRDRPPFVAMPSRKLNDGSHADIAHPICSEFREYIEKVILDAYDEEVARLEADPDAYHHHRGDEEGDEPRGDWPVP